MGRSRIGRDNPGRRLVRVQTESVETVSGHEAGPVPGQTLLAWMAAAPGEAGPFVFRVDHLQGLAADFEIAVYEPAERSQRMFSMKQGAGALNQKVQIKTGDRITITLLGVREESQGAPTAASGVWVSFPFTRQSESMVTELDE